MEKIVKFRLFEFSVEQPDMYDPDKVVLMPRMAYHGQRVSTDEAGDDPNVVYGLSDRELKKGERLGAFFTDTEIRVREIIGQPIVPVVTTETGEPVPVASTLDQLEQYQLTEWIMKDQPSADEMTQAIAASGNPELLGNRLLQAEVDASSGEPREEVLQAIAAYLGLGAARGPEGSEGVEGTAMAAGADEEPEGGGDGSQEITPPAMKFAQENDVDLEDPEILAQIKGTGSGGRVTQPDIVAYIKERDAEENPPQS